MRRKHIKIISVLCAIIIAFGLIHLPPFISRADDEILFDNVAGDGFRVITLSDIGGEDTDNTTDSMDFYCAEDKNNVRALDKTAFRAFVVFNNNTGSNKGTQLHLFTQNGGQTGIALTISGKGGKALELKRISTPGPSVNKVFYSKDAGLDVNTFNGTCFLLGLTVEFIDSDNDSDDDDLKLGVFFNNKLYENQYITIRNASSSSSFKMGTRINFTGEAGECYSYTTEKQFDSCPEASFDWLTLSDCGISDGSTSGVSGNLPVDSLSGKLFNFSAIFSSNSLGGTVFRFGNTAAGSNDGLILYAKSAGDKNLYLAKEGEQEIPLYLRHSGIGESSSVDTRFDLQISTEKAEEKLKVGIFINGALYRGEYFTFDNFDSFGTYFAFDGVAGSIYSMFAPISVEQSDSADFTLITLSDLGIADGSKDVSGYYGASFNKTILGFNITFSTDGTRLHYGPHSSNSYSGVGIRLSGDNLVLSCEAGSTEAKLLNLPTITITPVDAAIGSSTFKNTKFTLHISTEFGDFNSDGIENDIKLGLFFNGHLYKSQYIYIADGADRLSDRFNICEPGTKSYSSIESAPKPFPEHLKKITLTDAGIGVGRGAVSGEFATVESLDGTLFSARVKFKSNSSRMHIGTKEQAYGGLGVRLESGKIVVGNELGNKEGALSNIGLSLITIDAQATGVGDTFVDKEFLLQMSFEFIDRSGSGTADDIKLGVFINGNLYGNSYFYIADQADILGLGINFNEGGAEYYAPYGSDSEEAVPDNLKKITLSDARIGNRGGNARGTFITLDSLNNTLFSAKLKFELNGSRMHIGTKGKDYGGIGVRLDGNNIVLGNEIGDTEDAISGVPLSFIMIDPVSAKVGDTFIDKEFILQMSFQFVDNTGDGTADDIKLGVFVNGKLYADSYFYIFGQAEKFGTGINFNEGGAAMYASYGDVVPSGRAVYKELTPRDFMIADRTYKKASVVSVYDYATLDGTAVTMDLSFSKEGLDSTAVYFGKSWMGVRLEVRSDDSFRLSHLHKDGTQTVLVDIAPETVGLESFVETKFTLRLTFDIVKGAGDYIDYRLGAYINGKPVGDGAYLIKNTEPITLRSAMFIYSGKQGAISVATGSAAVDFSVFGFSNTTWRKTLNIS